MAGFQAQLMSAVRDRWTLVHFRRDRKEWGMCYRVQETSLGRTQRLIIT